MQKLSPILKFEVVRYGIVGVATVAIDILLFFLIFKFSDNYLLAENLKLPFVLGFNFLAHRVFTFKSQRARGKEFGKYLMGNIAIWMIANLMLIVLVKLSGDVDLAKISQAILMPIASYFIFKLGVFRPLFQNLQK